MLGDKPTWVRAHVGPKDRQFDGYPEESLGEWHERLGLSRPTASPSMQSPPAKVTAGHRGPIRGILFDKDGALLDFRATWIPAYRTAAAEIADPARGVDARTLLAAVGYDAAAGCHRGE